MRKLALILSLVLLLAGGIAGLLSAGVRMAWEEVPPPPERSGSLALPIVPQPEVTLDT